MILLGATPSPVQAPAAVVVVLVLLTHYPLPTAITPDSPGAAPRVSPRARPAHSPGEQGEGRLGRLGGDWAEGGWEIGGDEGGIQNKVIPVIL